MGYFPNGTSAEMYESNFCNRCVHQNGPTKDHEGRDGCRVMLLHLIWNYDACNGGPDGSADEAKKTALDLLIPRDDKGFNDVCTMFHEVDE